MATGKQYIDLEGLSKFKELLVSKYADGTFTVMTATNATNAEIATNYKTADGSASIKDALDSKADSNTLTTEVNKLVPKTTTIAGVNLQDNITASELIEALNNESSIVNIIETVKVKNNGDADFSALPVEGKAVQIDLSGYAKTSDITSVLKFKWAVDYENLLPTEGVKEGDVYHVRYAGESGDSGLNAEYVYISGRWELLGPVVDLSNYYTKSETDSAISSAVSTAKTEITTDYQTADTNLQTALQGKIDALYKVDGESVTGTIATRISAVETKANANETAINTLKGSESTEGSVAKAIKDKIATLNSSSSAASASDAKGSYVYSVNQTDGKVTVKTASFSGAVAQGDANAVTGGAVASYVTGEIAKLDVNDIGSAGSFISAVSETDGMVHAETTPFVATVKATTTEADNVAPNEHAVRQAIDGAYEMITSIPLTGDSGSIASIFANLVSKTRDLITGTIEVAESDTVTSIGDYAFMGCQELTSISFPVATSIGEMAFQGCSALTTLYIGTELDTVCTLSNTNAFTGCDNLTNIYVPEALVNSYKTASNWSSFTDKIKAYTGV